MELIDQEPDAVVIECTEHGISILKSAVNGTLGALEDWEFSTRMGAEIAEVRQLLDEVKTVIDARNERDEEGAY